MTTPKFTTRFDAIGETCRDWWINLAAIDLKTGEEKTGSMRNRGKIAELRRIGIESGDDIDHVDVAAAQGIGPYRQLHRQLSWVRDEVFRGSNRDDDFAQAVAVVAATLARVRSDKTPKQRVAARLGLGKDGRADLDDEAARVMAEARFKRLIRTRDWPGLLDHGRRIVALLGRDVSVADLGASLLLWNAGSLVVRRWTFDYYGADFAAPSDNDAEDGVSPTI